MFAEGCSPHPRGEDLFWQLYAYDGLQYRIQHFKPGLPLTTIIGLAGKERRGGTYTQKVTK
jgi:hypothetical protein